MATFSLKITILQCSPHRGELQFIIFHFFISTYVCKMINRPLKSLFVTDDNNTFSYNYLIALNHIESEKLKCLSITVNLRIPSRGVLKS